MVGAVMNFIMQNTRRMPAWRGPALWQHCAL